MYLFFKCQLHIIAFVDSIAKILVKTNEDMFICGFLLDYDIKGSWKGFFYLFSNGQ